MKRWEPVDIIVLVLAVAISVSILSTTLVPLALGTPISDERSRTLSAVGTAVLTLISLYVGARVERRRKDVESEPE